MILEPGQPRQRDVRQSLHALEGCAENLNNQVAEILSRIRKVQTQICSVEIISLTPRFNAVKHEHAKENRLNGFLSLHTFPHPAEAGC